MAPSGDEASAATVLLQQILANPSVGRDRLVQVLGLLDEDDRSLRLSAAWALCLIANDDEDLVKPIARRLVDRLADDPGQHETRHALAYLRVRFPEVVAETIATVAEEAAEREERKRYLDVASGMTRNNYFGGTTPGGGFGGANLASRGGSSDLRIYREGDDDPDSSGAGYDRRRRAPAEADEEEDEELAERRQEVAAIRRAATDAQVEEIAEESRFDELTIVAAQVEGRFSDVYRTRAEEGDSEQAIALRLLRAPDERREAFEEALAERLRNWAAIADHEDIVSLYDWGMEPDPWMATEYSTQTLYDRIDLSLDEAVQHGLWVAETVSYFHQRGVVHTGLDPYSVVYVDTALSTRVRPLVSNVGLLAAFRPYVQPANLLDPRYAAPEYFDTKFGDVDPATDIYHLGAIVYKLLTGRPPFQGSYEEVRSGVVGATPPAPSSLNPEIPTSLDDVVAKAMAKQKLTRYETAMQLVSDLKREYQE